MSRRGTQSQDSDAKSPKEADSAAPSASPRPRTRPRHHTATQAPHRYTSTGLSGPSNTPKTRPASRSTPNCPTHTAETRQDPNAGCSPAHPTSRHSRLVEAGQIVARGVSTCCTARPPAVRSSRSAGGPLVLNWPARTLARTASPRGRPANKRPRLVEARCRPPHAAPPRIRREQHEHAGNNTSTPESPRAPSETFVIAPAPVILASGLMAPHSGSVGLHALLTGSPRVTLRHDAPAVAYKAMAAAAMEHLSARIAWRPTLYPTVRLGAGVARWM